LTGDFNCVVLPVLSPGLAWTWDYQLEPPSLDTSTLRVVPTPDIHEDRFADDLDNCVEIANPTQYDDDGDLFGNACDRDFDNDGVCNIADFQIFLGDFTSQNDSGVGTDMDGGGGGDIGDFSPFLSGFVAGVPGPSGLVP
jgi:hypothetical protein